MNPSDLSYVVDRFRDIFGCEVPLRQGIGHVPSQPGDFGYQHIVARYNEGLVNHDASREARGLWQKALLQPGAAVGRQYECHSQNYMQGKKKRTMRVFVDYKAFRGYMYKGITTAYWVSGHKPCPTVNLQNDKETDS